MCAYRAYFGGLLANNDVAAVRALPDAVAVAGEDQIAFHIGEQLEVTSFMLLLNRTDLFKEECNVLEALFVRFLGKGRVHIRPLVIFAGCRCLEVFRRAADTFQQFEPNFCVFLFVIRRLLEYLGDLHIAIFLGFGGVVSILIACHRFARKCGLEVCFRLASLQICHNHILLTL